MNAKKNAGRGFSTKSKDNLRIIMDGSRTKVALFLDEDIADPPAYRDFLYTLSNLGVHDEVDIFINTEGGSIVSAINIVNAANNTAAKVTGILDGYAYSSGSLILLQLPNVEIRPSSSLMIHQASIYDVGGKAGEALADISFFRRDCWDFYKKAYNGFLTAEELKKVENGQALYFNTRQIKARLAQRDKLKKGNQ